MYPYLIARLWIMDKKSLSERDICTKFITLAEGGAQPNLNVGKIKNTLIPLPPLPEQHRIVTKVDQLMALCDKLEEKIDQATDKQTTLLNAVMAKI